VNGRQIRDVLLVVDVLDDFRHDDGDALLASFRARSVGMRDALASARAGGVPIVYANDNRGVWDGDRDRLVREAAQDGPGGDVVTPLLPLECERLVVKPRYSAFDLTPLSLLLADLDTERLVVMGATAEMCVTQTAIDAREQQLKVTVLADACACIDPRLEQVAFAYLRDVTGTFVETVADWTRAAAGQGAVRGR
jgi:nicotinamidase-related amidase